MSDHKTKDEVKAEARERILRDLERTDANFKLCDAAAKAKFDDLFNKTVGNAIDKWGTNEWTVEKARRYIRRHVRLVARIARHLAKDGGRDCLSADDLDYATDVVIKRARKACAKMSKKDFEIFGHPCAGY